MAALYRFTATTQAVAHPPPKKKEEEERTKKKSLKPVCRKEPLCKAFIMAELLSKWLSGNHQSFLKGIQWFPDRRKKKFNHLCLLHIVLTETLKTPMEKFSCSWHGNVWEILRRPDVNLHRPKVSAGGGKKLTFKKKTFLTPASLSAVSVHGHMCEVVQHQRLVLKRGGKLRVAINYNSRRTSRFFFCAAFACVTSSAARQFFAVIVS